MQSNEQRITVNSKEEIKSLVLEKLSKECMPNFQNEIKVYPSEY